MKRLIAISIVLASALLCVNLAAHELPTERKLVVDVGPESVEMLLVYQRPKGHQVSLLVRKYDLDGDGKLTGGEAKLAGREWIPRMLHGLQFEVAGERPRAHEPEIKFQREDDGALTAAVYMKWSLDALEPGRQRTFIARVLDTNGAVKTLVDLRPADGLRAEPLAERIVEPGDEASLTARRDDREE
jgi:hypothetical protein